MRQILLDTNILIDDPTVLARSAPGIQMIVPSVVLKQLENFDHSTPRLSRLSELVRRAAAENNISIQNSRRRYQQRSDELDDADEILVEQAQQLRESGGDVAIATRDMRLQREADRLRNRLGIISRFQPPSGIAR